MNKKVVTNLIKNIIRETVLNESKTVEGNSIEKLKKNIKMMILKEISHSGALLVTQVKGSVSSPKTTSSNSKNTQTISNQAYLQEIIPIILMKKVMENLMIFLNINQTMPNLEQITHWGNLNDD